MAKKKIAPTNQTTVRDYIVKNQSRIPLEKIARQLGKMRLAAPDFRDSQTVVELNESGVPQQVGDKTVGSKPEPKPEPKAELPAKEAKKEDSEEQKTF